MYTEYFRKCSRFCIYKYTTVSIMALRLHSKTKSEPSKQFFFRKLSSRFLSSLHPGLDVHVWVHLGPQLQALRNLPRQLVFVIPVGPFQGFGRIERVAPLGKALPLSRNRCTCSGDRRRITVFGLRSKDDIWPRGHPLGPAQSRPLPGEPFKLFLYQSL